MTDFPAFTELGMYTLIYVDPSTGDVLCPECAKAEHDDQDTRFEQTVYWEGPPEICANCNREIESAYGDPDEEESDE